ncbi:hypothetical protein TNCT_170421 [Trichonephila clavata]|uniref:Secreted protein n=1 Tax=Trichonephila clavata TaxID=2740835 RepID=A0A8X6F6Y4_TRICU|nr:hypothetical protein TNCT_170421 [Trichonephila clavata]
MLNSIALFLILPYLRGYGADRCHLWFRSAGTDHLYRAMHLSREGAGFCTKISAIVLQRPYLWVYGVDCCHLWCRSVGTDPLLHARHVSREGEGLCTKLSAHWEIPATLATVTSQCLPTGKLPERETTDWLSTLDIEAWPDTHTSVMHIPPSGRGLHANSSTHEPRRPVGLGSLDPPSSGLRAHHH